MKKITFFFILIAACLLGVLFFIFHKEDVKNFEDCVAVSGEIMETYPRKCKTIDGFVFTETVEQNNVSIRVNSLHSGSSVSSPLVISGEARGKWFFEASFPVELINEQGEVIASVVAMATANSLTDDFVPFKTEINFVSEKSQIGYVVFKNDNPSGLPENDEQFRIPVVISGQEVVTVKAYFANNTLDKEITCEKVFPVERKIVKTAAIARATLEELLKGVNENEKKIGYRTNINTGVVINKLVIEDGVAKVDFNNTLGEGVGGSCRVLLIRKQIEETLKQFQAVKDVIISIEGDSKYILQP